MAGVGFQRWVRTLSKGKISAFSALLPARRAAAGLSKDMLPGPVPTTHQEMVAAAKKYNMRLEDYKPYPDQGEGYGDYPHLPDTSQHERDPSYEWDHPDLRRNWGEPMHWQFDMYIRNRVDTSPTPISMSSMYKQLFGFLGFMLLMFYLGNKFPAYQPIAPKQFPYNNLHVERGGSPDVEPEEVKNYEI